ncbi:hypothetical protein TruAng_004405 [Truncatella angustata]|nr:hypothetical protein TruAng_004405 [Truncatella angustata]
MQLISSFSVLLFSAVLALASSDYHEQLVLKPLPQNSLLASFNFKSNTTVAQFEAHNFRYFPRSLGQILQHAGTRELHLRFSLGRWDAETWGARPWDGTKEGGTGVELWAWLEAETHDEADHKWLTLTNALSGLFCASLNFIDSTRTTRPLMSFRPDGDHPNATLANTHLLHGVLPREVVCTENLTPFLKLLPCKGKAGISTLLDGHKLFDASWQSMAIDVRPVCPAGGEACHTLQTPGNPIPRPPPGHELKCNTTKEYHSGDTCFPIETLSPQDWTLSELFGRSMKGSCPLADSTIPPICIQAPHSRDVFTSAGVTELKLKDTERCFLVHPEDDFDMVLPQMSHEGDNAKTDADEYLKPDRPLLYAERSFMGHGQQRGGVQTILTNPSPDTEVEFVYMESLPWFMRIYLHTLQARISHKTGSDKGKALVQENDVIQEIYYRPFLDRERGTQLELRMRIPPASTVFMTYDFEQAILRYTEYPPDANRGFDVAAAIITIIPPFGKTSNLRTTSLLLNLPTPDFSMPYNVIIFTSTCIALAFGGLYNILVRRFIGGDEGPEVTLVKLRRKIQEAVGRLKSKLKKTETKGALAPLAQEKAEGKVD